MVMTGESDMSIQLIGRGSTSEVGLEKLFFVKREYVKGSRLIGRLRSLIFFVLSTAFIIGKVATIA